MVIAQLNLETCTPTIDEGSEINCIDANFATKSKLPKVPTTCSARAAGSTAMVVTGQTLHDVILKVPHEKTSIQWNLSKCVVVEDLGVDILIGEPGKVDNEIVTKPHLKRLETKDTNGNTIDIPYFKRTDEKRFLCRAVKNETLLPGEALVFHLPPHLVDEQALALAPTRENPSNFVQPKIVSVDEEKAVQIVNDGPTPVHVRKNSCIADITALKNVNCEKVCVEPSDQSHLERPAIFSKSEVDKSYTDEILIDPDKQLPEGWIGKFRDTCEKFRDVINPNPGRYNNSYGNVDCSLDFCSTPPPSVKARLPNYSTEKMKIMAEQMDKMETMGVLAKPEDVGVVPSFVVPSLLVPKPEKGEWRLVSDFTPLNIHIRKFETISPGIEEVKRTLA